MRETPQIRCRNELFTDDTARMFAGHAVLFISDVRSADWSLQDDDEADHRVRDDQSMQMRWHDLMRPAASMLKFRLPWTPGQTEYLDGTIYLPVWGPITTTETRLFVHHPPPPTPPAASDGDALPAPAPAPRRLDDHERYMHQLFYFNTTTRVALFPHDVVATGLDHCYDCRAEVEILSRYLVTVCAHKGPWTPERLHARVAAMSETASRKCAHTRTLASQNCDPEERQMGIQARQWIRGVPTYHAAHKRRRDDTDEPAALETIPRQAGAVTGGDSDAH